MEQSPLQPTPVGAFRFNTDTSKLEYYDGNQWLNIDSNSPGVLTGHSHSGIFGGDGTRGLFGGGYTSPSLHNVISYVTISSTGNATDFGDLVTARSEVRGMSDRTRGVFVGGRNPEPATWINVVDYVTIEENANATDFGDLSTARGAVTPLSNNNRGVAIQGATPSNVNVIDYCTIQSAGNFVDFGDLTGGNNMQKACVSDSHGGLGGF